MSQYMYNLPRIQHDFVIHIIKALNVVPLQRKCGGMKARLTVFVRDSSYRGVFVKQLMALNSMSFYSGRQCQWWRWHV